MSNTRSIRRFGEKLHALRVQRGLTLKELANELGLTAHGYISELEAGKKMPTAEFVLNVARLFEVTTDELLKDEVELVVGERE
jgi:transcriptional regulator with XRE-family HTH domain